MANVPQDLILDTSREVLQGAIRMDVIQPAIETVESGVLDMVKEALSKIDTDEVAAILTNAVKDFGEIAQKYPELANAYDKLQTMRVNATLYRGLERQKIFDGAKEAKNNALVAAKDFGNEINQLTSSMLHVPEKTSRTNTITPRYTNYLANTPMYISTGNPDLSNYGYRSPWTESVFMPQTKTDFKTVWNAIKVAPKAIKQKQIIDEMLNKFVETENVPINLRNSLRHRAGSAIMSNMNGPDVARVYGNFKEVADLAILKENDSLFDLSNNELGRRLQSQTPFLTNEELLRLVYEDIKKHPLPPDNYKDRWLMELYWQLFYLWNDFGYTRWRNFKQFQKDVIDFIRLRLEQPKSSN